MACASAIDGSAIAALILYVPGGDTALNAMAGAVENVIAYANVGIQFLFGALGERKPGTLIFAIHVLPVIVFFAALMATLYYLGIMQKVVSILGGASRLRLYGKIGCS